MHCAAPDCQKPRVSKGMCNTHYQRTRRHGGWESKTPTRGTDAITYIGAHYRVYALWGKASLYTCVECGTGAEEWAYDGTDPSEKTGVVKSHGYVHTLSYSAWPEFYIPLCGSCHKRKDNIIRNINTLLAPQRNVAQDSTNTPTQEVAK